MATAGQWGFCEARLRAKAKRQAVQWIDGPDKTGSDGFGDQDLGVKPGEDESVRQRRVPQPEVQKLELKQQPASREHKHETQVAPPDPQEGTQEAPTNSEKETREVPSDAEEKT